MRRYQLLRDYLPAYLCLGCPPIVAATLFWLVS